MKPPVLLLGASARAAAQSAARAGFAVCAADLFADRDLREAAIEARGVENYPEDLEAVAAKFPVCPWSYTGALENWPDLVERLAKRRPLWGVSAQTLRQVRDPAQWTAALAAAGLPHLEVAFSTKPSQGDWIAKPLRSAGGGWSKPGKEISADFFQRRARGVDCGAVFVAAAGESHLLGVTRQLIGCDWAGAEGLVYVGSIGPLPLSGPIAENWRRIGETLVERFALQGLFGVDAVVDSTAVWPVEINPRYTASVEILERGLGVSAFALHAAACRGEAVEYRPPKTRTPHGKAIVYAGEEVVITPGWRDWVETLNAGARWPVIADLPETGQTFPPGSPIATVFAWGEDVERRLRERIGRRVKRGNNRR